MTDQAQEVQDTTTTEQPKVDKVSRVITMEDGSEVDFGSRSNLLVTPDLEDNSITFRLSNGKIISWKPAEAKDSEGVDIFPGLADFPELVRKVLIYGLQERVKSVTGPIKEVAEIQEAIEKQIAAINAGNFYVRSLGGGAEPESTLTNLQIAYAKAKALLKPEEFGHWADTSKPEVIAEVLTAWEGFDRKAVGSIRSNASVQFQLSQLKLQSGKVSELI